MKYRSRTDIITAILGSVSGGGQTKTRIMYSAYLSYAQAQQYLEFLITKGLLAEEAGVFKPTLKGMELLHTFEGISDLISPAKPTETPRTGQVGFSWGF